mmetsp:Transcript_31402/g.66491  ORF Transcript_31402/g.66491 Transcript_31402/m.66491 type:complete len:356 (+) Transcript_31402:198-1265(+)
MVMIICQPTTWSIGTTNLFHHSCMIYLLLMTSYLLCANSFSLTFPKVHQLKTNADEPIILSLPDILSTDETSRMITAIESSAQNDDLVSTNSYQEDIFSRDKWEEEEIILKDIIRPLLDEQLIPWEYAEKLGIDQDAALRVFVYAVTKYQEKLSEDEIILGANIIQRRQAIERWKSEDGQAIMQLSLDNNGSESEQVDWDSISLGKRYELPPIILKELEELVPRLLKGSWITRDATLVKYSEGDSQVAHVDPCDATLLICLKSCDNGGDTCFPLLEQPLRLENREGSGILFFSSNKIKGDSSGNTLSLHHGGKVAKGEKVVVQLMLDLDDNNDEKMSATGTWLDVLCESTLDKHL